MSEDKLCPSCREPLNCPSGDGCANMTAHRERVVGDFKPDWKNFAKAVLADWPTDDLEGSVLFDLSLQYGMIKEVPGGYNSEHHFDNYVICPEEGDPWYEYTFGGEAGPGLYSITSLTEQLAAAQQDANEAEAYAEELEKELNTCRMAQAVMDNTVADLEAKLAKAVKALRLVVTAKGLTDPTEYGYDAIVSARTTLAELKGESHE